MHSILTYLLYWLATGVGVAFIGGVLIVETLAVLALLGSAKRAAASEVVREEPSIIEQPRT